MDFHADTHNIWWNSVVFSHIPAHPMSLISAKVMPYQRDTSFVNRHGLHNKSQMSMIGIFRISWRTSMKSMYQTPSATTMPMPAKIAIHEWQMTEKKMHGWNRGARVGKWLWKQKAVIQFTFYSLSMAFYVLSYCMSFLSFKCIKLSIKLCAINLMVNKSEASNSIATIIYPDKALKTAPA